MADATLQAQLGLDARIITRVDSGLKCDYYVVAGAKYAGRSRWIQCTAADSDNTKETAIRAELLKP